MLRWLRERLGREGSDSPPKNYPSLVVLLKEPKFQTSESALQTAQRAWAFHGPVEIVGSLNGGTSYVLKCGKFFFSVVQADGPYEVDFHESALSLQLPWKEHKAWMAIDLPNQSSMKLRELGGLGIAYRFLLYYALQIWSPNCIGLYFPAEQVSLPNLGDLADSIQWARRNGQNLGFLLMPKNAKE